MAAEVATWSNLPKLLRPVLLGELPFHCCVSCILRRKMAKEFAASSPSGKSGARSGASMIGTAALKPKRATGRKVVAASLKQLVEEGRAGTVNALVSMDVTFEYAAVLMTQWKDASLDLVCAAPDRPRSTTCSGCVASS